jgi:site-specific DNA recombinase
VPVAVGASPAPSPPGKLGVRYRYYTCASRVQYGSARCDQARLRADALEEAVLTHVLANLRDTRVVRRSMDKALQGFDSVQPKLQREFDGALRKLKETQAAIDKYLRAFETGSMSPDVCGPRLAELYGLLHDLERRRDEQEIQLSAREALPDFGTVSAAAAHWAEELESADMPLFKHLFGTLVPEILVESRSNIRSVIHLPWVRVVCHSVEPTPNNANPKVRLECGPLREIPRREERPRARRPSLRASEEAAARTRLSRSPPQRSGEGDGSLFLVG